MAITSNSTPLLEPLLVTPNGTLPPTLPAVTIPGATITGGTANGVTLGGTSPCPIAGDLQLLKTVTAAGTAGAQTINKTAGAVNFAALATTLVVTNSLVTANSVILCTVATNDATMLSAQVVAAAGSFTIYANAGATAETRVNFIVTN